MRWKKTINIFDNLFLKNKYKKKKKNIYLIKRRKIKNNFYPININTIYLKYITIITKSYRIQTKPYKKFIITNTLDNHTIIIPGIEFLNVGKILYGLNFLKNYNDFFFKGFICFLGSLPINTHFSNVFNVLNTRVVYAKSGGTYCKTRKNKKKKKLIIVILPSSRTIYLSKFTKVYVGKNTNYNINRLVEGKYGFSFYKKNKISVRGVAMNPVDHANGGRTKTVKPEKSPWNWVAKRKK